MPFIQYTKRAFNYKSRALIREANVILDEWEAKGFDLTLRQLFYQFVSRNIVENTMRAYDNLGSLVNDARLAGYIDWSRIVDRTRNLRSVGHFENPADIIRTAADAFRLDKWKDQSYRPEVWVEKDALVGVIERISTELDVPFFSCRGYVSQSEMWSAGQRMLQHIKNGQAPVVLHLGDHDPSGIQMTDDITNRLRLFISHHAVEDLGFDPADLVVSVQRLGLNMDQIRELKPPPQQAKLKDDRYAGYVKRFKTTDSWELDALDPEYIADRIRIAVMGLRDEKKWKAVQKKEDTHRALLADTSARWNDITTFLSKPGKPKR